MTEDDIRRIVREEIAKALSERVYNIREVRGFPPGYPRS